MKKMDEKTEHFAGPQFTGLKLQNEQSLRHADNVCCRHRDDVMACQGDWK